MANTCRLLLLGSLSFLIVAHAADDCGDIDAAKMSAEWARCLEHHAMSAHFKQILHLDFWSTLCSASASLEKCVDEHFANCDKTILEQLHKDSMQYLMKTGRHVWYPGSADVIIGEVCHGDLPSDVIRKLFEQQGMDDCVDADVEIAVEGCVGAWLGELSDVRGDWESVSTDRQRSLNRFANSAFKCVLNSVWHHLHCPDQLIRGLMFAVNLTLPLPMRSHFPVDTVARPLSEMDTLSTERATVGVFGDPHLLVYDVISPVTCSSEGLQLLLSNPLMKISGGIRRVGHSDATALKSLEINFMFSGRSYGAYYAEHGKLPSQFAGFQDGMPLGVQRSRQIDITTVLSNEKIRLNSTTRAFELLIQRRDDEYMFSLRLGKGVLASSHGLLVTGCSHRNGHVLATNTTFSENHSGTTKEECESACGQLETNTTLNIVPQCVFDCRTTGMLKYAAIAEDFLADVAELEERDEMLYLIPPAPTDQQELIFNKSPRLTAPSLVTLILSYAAVLCKR